MSFFERHPALKRAIANQYQAILVLGAVGFAGVLASPLPLLLWAGLQMMTLPFLVERAKRRLEIERKYADRQVATLSQEEQFGALPGASRARFQRLQELCRSIQANYRGLSPASQGLLAEQAAKFDAMLAAILRRLWLLQKYDEIAAGSDHGKVGQEIARLNRQLADQELAPRVREALQKNLEIQQELLRALDKNEQSREALAAEIDSFASLLELLRQKSVAATDATAFSAEIDDVLAQVEADAASVEELERMLGGMPEAESPTPLSPKLKLPLTAPPPPPPPERTRTRR